MPAAIEACQEQDGHAPISQSRARKSGSNLYSRVDRALLNDANGAARLLNRVPSPKVILHELVKSYLAKMCFWLTSETELAAMGVESLQVTWQTALSQRTFRLHIQ